MPPPYIPNELLLHVAEHCDLQTLSNLMQTSKEVHSLLDSKCHSISKTMIERHPMPPPADGLILTLRKGRRFLISERNSFTTVQELLRRERRISSLLGHGGFLLTGADSPLRLARPALEKLKQGLTHAMRLTDRLADADGCREIVEQLTQDASPPRGADLRVSWRTHHKVDHITSHPVPQDDVLRSRLFTAYEKQKAILASLSTSELAWLVTLTDGAAMGFQRYTAGRYKNPGARAVVNLAFEEVVLRYGSSAMWAFVRGDKTEARFWRMRAAHCVCEITWWEQVGSTARTATGEKFLPDGLHMTIMLELRRRFIREETEAWERRREAKKEDEDEDDGSDGSDSSDDYAPDSFEAADTWIRVNEIIKNEIGARLWFGYANIEWPSAFESVADSASSTASASLS